MPDLRKYDVILDALQQLLEEKKIQNISVSEIAHKAGIGKGSIYYYFPSKGAILDALIERSYENRFSLPKILLPKLMFRHLPEWQCCSRRAKIPPLLLSPKTATLLTTPAHRILPFCIRNT